MILSTELSIGISIFLLNVTILYFKLTNKYNDFYLAETLNSSLHENTILSIPKSWFSLQWRQRRESNSLWLSVSCKRLIPSNYHLSNVQLVRKYQQMEIWIQYYLICHLSICVDFFRSSYFILITVLDTVLCNRCNSILCSIYYNEGTKYTISLHFTSKFIVNLVSSSFYA